MRKNSASILRAWAIDGLAIREYFDVILISEVEQVRRPQVEIFQRAMNRLEVSASNRVFFGDHPDVDIVGAKGTIMKTIWKLNSSWTEAQEADVIVDELNEIPPILAQFNS